MTRGQQLFDFGRDRLAFDLHALDGFGDAGGVPQLERSHLPVEAELHGAIDFDDRVGDLANAIRGVGPEVGQSRPEKDAGFVFRRREQHLQALGQVVDRLGHLQRWELRPLRRTIFHRLPVEREDLCFAVFLVFAVEAALGFVAEPLALQHLQEEARQHEIAALVVNVGGRIADDVSQNVEADEIGEAKRRHLRPADSGSRQRVHFFDAEVHLLHQAHDVERGECSNAIGDEVRRVFGMDHALAQVEIAEVRDGLHRGGIGVGRGDQLQQAHVARRIEEVRAEPEAAKVIGKAFDDLGHRQAAGVGGNDGAGLANGFDLAQQAALDLQVFDDGLDDPIHVGQFVKIVFEVPDGDQARERRLEEGGRLRLDCGFQAGGGNAIARGAVGVGRNDVE